MSNLAKAKNETGTNEWETPKWLFNALNKEFKFTMDLACTEKNNKCGFGFAREKYDSLNIDWHKYPGWLWLNPPYSPLRPWIEKVHKEVLLGAKIVMLVPPQSPSKYWVNVLPSEIRHILGRISFIDEQGKAVKGNNRDSAIYVYGPCVMPKVSYINRDELAASAT